MTAAPRNEEAGEQGDRGARGSIYAYETREGVLSNWAATLKQLNT
jgi:hypothetical protein